MGPGRREEELRPLRRRTPSPSPLSPFGTVFGASGDPLTGVRVDLSAGFTETYPARDTPQEREALRRRSQRKPISYHVDTDELGRFRINGLTPGAYLLRLSCGPPHSDCPETLVSVEVPDDDGLRIEVEEGAEIHVVLVDEKDKVMTRYSYQIGPHEAPGSGLTAPVHSLEGLVVIRGLGALIYRLGIGLPDGRTGEVLVDPNLGPKILLKLPPADHKELLLQYVRE